MRSFLIVLVSLAVLAAALAESPECVSHQNNDPSASPCDGKTHKTRDRRTETTYCCADDSLRPVGRRSVRANQEYEYQCSCLTHSEYCKNYPLFCGGFSG